MSFPLVMILGPTNTARVGSSMKSSMTSPPATIAAIHRPLRQLYPALLLTNSVALTSSLYENTTRYLYERTESLHTAFKLARANLEVELPTRACYIPFFFFPI